MLALVIAAITGCKTGSFYPATPNTDYPYSFRWVPFINPRIIQDLSCWISDKGDQVVAINLTDSQDSNRYDADTQVREIEGQNPYVFVSTTNNDETSEFGYQYIGRTTSGINVLLTSDSEDGSGVFKKLLLVTFEHDQGISYDWDKKVTNTKKKRVLIRKAGEIFLGDRWAGELSVTGNSILVGQDTGWFTVSGGAGRKWFNHDQKTDIKIDLNR